jgi:hypothetical protein
MNAREREDQALSFRKAVDRGPVLETFQPWTLTIDRFLQQGLPLEIGGPLSSDHDIGGPLSLMYRPHGENLSLPTSPGWASIP